MAERVVAPRYKHAVPIKLGFEPGGNTGRLDTAPKYVFLMGETVDLSTSGIGFTVSAIRIKESYLVGENRLLNVELDLPHGKVSMKVIGRRYEQIGEQVSATRYFIGASIEEISDENREAYNNFLRYGRGNTGSLKFGIDESR